MKGAHLHHVQLAMPSGEEATAAAFYEGVLGIPQVPKPLHLAARGGCWFEIDDLRIHLGIDDPFTPATKAHPAIQVEELDHLRGRLQDSGVEVVADQPLPGYDRFYVNDPFGNRLEFLEPKP